MTRTAVRDFGPDDRVGLIGPSLDAHTLGIGSVARLLADCGVRVVEAGTEERDAASAPWAPGNGRALAAWIRANRITVLGFSYRLDPADGVRLFGAFLDALRGSLSLAADGGTVRALLFAGLPETCALVAERFPLVSGIFSGEETPAETLAAFGIPSAAVSADAAAGVAYDEARMSFGRDLVARGDWLGVRSVDRSGAPRFGLRGDGIVGRIVHGRSLALPPLIRAHVGPYLPDRREAVRLFLSWTRQLARGGLLDVLSIGISQLSQSAFGEDHEGMLDGGGVPINSPGEYSDVWSAARPMLVRTYAGTKDVGRLARMYEERIDIAWHAFSFWWFCETDGRGPNGVLENLGEHLGALRFVAASGKPFEPNVPHHFAFRGADDATYVVSGFLAAKAAKLAGVRFLVLQVMLNTPRSTWGVQDLAKARALLSLARELEDGGFRVFLQPRGGLDYFSADEAKAKAQLAAVTALMDDIEPENGASPDIIHVVSHSEGRGLADPPVIEESVRITRHALVQWRKVRASGYAVDLARDAEVEARTSALLSEARTLVAAFESSVPDPYSARGLYDALAFGFLAAPWLLGCRGEFPAATAWRTGLSGGAVRVVDAEGRPVPASERAAVCAERARAAVAARAAGRG
ncbi:MAG: cobalamin-binding protein [Spirochaetes bacterium]|nr:cobalamin-binding protein [Spirochaetota bacterium]